MKKLEKFKYLKGTYVLMVLKLEFDKELEQKFREVAMRKFGYSKGSLKKAGEEAIQNWIKDKNRLHIVEDPVNLIEGILSHLKGKYTSVELQHEAVKLWTKEK